MCEVALLGATIGDGVVGAVVPWGLYSIGSNILPSTCLRCPLWASSSSLAAGDLGRETEKQFLRWRAWLLEYAVVETL